MIDHRLHKSINSGRCFVLIGSGPSCEAGYPSWGKLANDLYDAIKLRISDLDTASYEKYLSNNKFPEFFELAEKDLGSRDSLVETLKPLLAPSTFSRSIIYEYLARWPFACYVTTNYDDEIQKHLEKLGEYFTTVRNRKEDFALFRDGVSSYIQKLHSDFDHPSEAVITSLDYQKLYSGHEGQYFRDKLRQEFEMFDFFIIGHSLADPNISYILELAKTTASPQHPIYMAMADFTQAEEREFFEKYNIELIRYSNNDQQHSELKKILSAVDRYILPRDSVPYHMVPSADLKEKSAVAESLFIFRRLQTVGLNQGLAPLILTTLAELDKGCTADEISKASPLSTLHVRNGKFLDTIDDSLASLHKDGLVNVENSLFYMTDHGRTEIKNGQTTRDAERDQAYGQFTLNIRRNYRDLTLQQEKLCQELAEIVIVEGFTSRGLSIANQVFTGQPAGSNELSDLFRQASKISAKLETLPLKTAFVEAIHELLVKPTAPQKKYLASVSQGFFLYHSLGKDPACAKFRLDQFQQTLWVCDSSVLLPLLAVGNHKYEYSKTLFEMLYSAEAVLITTPYLLREVQEHLEWAVNFIKFNGSDKLEFLRAALGKGSYKQNLFIDGYINLAADGTVNSFKDYLNSMSLDVNDKSTMMELLSRHNIFIQDLSKIEGFEEQHWGEMEEAKARITEKRILSGTFRSELQTQSEARVWLLIKYLRSGKYKLPEYDRGISKAYFVSQGRILNSVFDSDEVLTWNSEGLYRYVSAMPGKETDPDLLQQCMLSDYSNQGNLYIDENRYKKYFGSVVNTANMSFEKEKDQYLREVESGSTRNIEEDFAATPDLEKPFFVSQMGWKLASVSKHREDAMSKRALEAEAQVKQLEGQRDNAWIKREAQKEEQEAARLRNLQNPKHAQKRRRQKKKKGKKK